MRFAAAALPVIVAACWTDAKLPPQTPIGAVEPTAKRKIAEPPADDSPPPVAEITGTDDGIFDLDDTNIYGGLVGNLNGGAIISGGTGATVAGGGAVFGGGGAGQGYGLSNTQPGAKPLVKLGVPMISGLYLPEVLRRFIHRQVAAMEFCYEQQLVVMPTLSGTITLRFTIGADGKIAGAAADSPPAMHVLAQCVQRQISVIQLPSPTAGAVQVIYPVMFSAP